MKNLGFSWHHLLPMRDSIDVKTRGVNSDYDLVFGQVPEKGCGTGYTNFTLRRCWLNTEAVDAGPTEQFIVSVFIAAHERAHARWTDYEESDFHRRSPAGDVIAGPRGPAVDAVLHQAWNILEDERIERLLGRDFPHLHPYLHKGSDLLLSIIPRATGDDDPTEVLKWLLRRRVLDRAGRSEPVPLSANNRALLARVDPIAEQAFSATNSRDVVQRAREILEILDLPQGGSGRLFEILSGQEGHRVGADQAREDGATAEEGGLYSITGRTDIDGEVRGLISGCGYSPEVRRGGRVQPAPYEDLLASVRPSVAEVSRLFQIPPSRRQTMLEESGTRLSIRAARRTPKTPFRVESRDLRRGRVALTLVIDDSGSMGGRREAQAKATALLCREALHPGHRVRAVLAPTGRVVADPTLNEMSRAYIAGYDSESGTEYHRVMATELKGLIKLGNSYVRYLVIVGDGASGRDDGARCAALAQKARRHGIHTFGVGLELDRGAREFFEMIFGRGYIDLLDAAELPRRMQAVLRRAAHNRGKVVA
jgi:hypothetical protein